MFVILDSTKIYKHFHITDTIFRITRQLQRANMTVTSRIAKGAWTFWVRSVRNHRRILELATQFAINVCSRITMSVRLSGTESERWLKFISRQIIDVCGSLALPIFIQIDLLSRTDTISPYKKGLKSWTLWECWKQDKHNVSSSNSSCVEVRKRGAMSMVTLIGMKDHLTSIGCAN